LSIGGKKYGGKGNEGKRGTLARKFIDIDLIIKQFEVPEEDFPFSI
jgi:hypothetical protein